MLTRDPPSEEKQRESAVLMAQAAATGLPMAIYLHGVMFEYGIGVEHDWARAAQLYKRSAEAGVRPG